MASPELHVPIGLPDQPLVLVREFRTDVSGRWDEFVRSHPDGSPFHLTAWMRALQNTFGYTPAYLYAEQGNQITGVLPLFRISNWATGTCFLSTPFAVYGGICAADTQSAEALRDYAVWLATRERVDFLELRSRRAEGVPGFHTKNLYVGFASVLAHHVEDNLKRLPRDTRYMIRKGEKAGLHTRSGLEQLPALYDLFAVSMRRLGTPVLPYRWLLKLAEEYEANVDITLAYASGRAVAGTFSFVFRDTLLPYYAGATLDATKVAANNFLYWELMKKAVDLGLRRFDFGRSKKGTGAFEFKSSWNMKPEPLDYQFYLVKRHDVPNLSPVNSKFDLAVRLWRRMPLWLTKWLGPPVVRYFP